MSRKNPGVWSEKLRGAEAWKADGSYDSSHIPFQLQRERGGDSEGALCHVTEHLPEHKWLRAEKST